MEIFAANNVTKRYASVLALDDVSISVNRQSIYGLLGPNGAGKTTLIRIINQITAPDEGELLFKNEKLRTDHIKDIGYLPEERGLYKKMKVGEQCVYLARLKGLSKNDALRKLKYWFEKFEIQEWWNKKVEELSKGMQQKIQFIVTILHEPELLIFDEPFTGFDPINTNLLKEEILNLQKKGSTIIFSTHNMESVEELCDDITLINNSKCLLQGNIEDIKHKFRNNIYEVGFDGEFNISQSEILSNCEVLDQKKSGYISNLRIKLCNGYTTNELLVSMTKAGNVVSFNEVIPKMRDIFISVVSEQNQSKVN